MSSGRTRQESLQILFRQGSSGPQVLAPGADAAPPVPEIEISLAAWRSDDFSFWHFDRQVEALAARCGDGPFAVRLRGEARQLAEAARQVAARCQRLSCSRNDASSGETFERVLEAHRRLFDLGQSKGSAGSAGPAAAAEHARALDRWQWLLRLDPAAGLEPQIAALFHDADRLTATPATERRDGTSGGAGRSEQVRCGAWMADELLADLGVGLATRVRVHEMIRGHESVRLPAAPSGGAADDLRLLRSADALSFLSLDSAENLRCAGAGETRRTRCMVARALASLSADCRHHLGSLRLCQPVQLMIVCELARQQTAPRPLARLACRADAAPGSRGAGDSLAAGSPLADRVIGPSGVLGAIDALGRGDGHPSPAKVMARSRRAVGMLGGAGLAPSRLTPLLARAEAIGALGAGSDRTAAPARVLGNP